MRAFSVCETLRLSLRSGTQFSYSVSHISDTMIFSFSSYPGIFAEYVDCMLRRISHMSFAQPLPRRGIYSKLRALSIGST